MRLFGILILSFVLPAAASATPVKLTDAQMDVISAGLAVAVSADAVATGATAIALTDTTTKLRSGRRFDFAIGRGLAVAVGSESAATSVDLFGEGDFVRVWTRTISFVTADDLLASKTIGVVFAIEFNNDRARTVGARWHGPRHRHGRGTRLRL